MIFPPEIISTMNLESPLGFAALILFSLGGETKAHINKSALQHDSIRISFSSQKIGTIRAITWRFEKNGKLFTILDSTEKPYYIYDSQFRDRLLMSDDLYTMTITDLTLQDAGVYTVDVTDTNGSADIYSFNVTVYEPTPLPTITTHEEKDRERCNVTLICSVPSSSSDLSYYWKSRHQDSTYQPYSNGSIIQISVPPDHQDMEYLCIVHNPVDQKNVSTSVKSCSGNRSSSLFSRSHFFIIPLLMALIILLVTIIFIYLKNKKRHRASEES
ncbi:SLAM family member 5-like isoform 2-T2 [Anomaloglossus baeobatrachus]|uniref:SLAM family member 5-like isoform X2 n=1 Tax=Anomaloglossus baeobatrachus TaxID=238106 RepID=UPI003F4FF947